MNEENRRPGPRSSWARMRRRIFPRGLTFTRQGKVYTGISLGVGFAAINTGNNLLFLILGLLLGLIVVSGILSEITLRRIAVKRKVPARVEEGMPFPVELTLVNNKNFAASFGVELRDEIDGTLFRRRCFFLRVGGKESRSVAYQCELNQRGRSRFEGTVVSTRFPFGLFEKRRFIKLEDDLIVLPGRISLDPLSMPANEGHGTGVASLPGMGQDFRELREMNDGDDPRRIHWKSTARLGRPYVVETDKDAQELVEIVLDPSVSGSNKEDLEQVEQNIRAAGTMIRDTTQKHVTAKLITPGRSVMVADNQGAAVALLVNLALIDPAEAAQKSSPFGESTSSVLIGPRAGSRGRGFRLTVPPSSKSEGK